MPFGFRPDEEEEEQLAQAPSFGFQPDIGGEQFGFRPSPTGREPTFKEMSFLGKVLDIIGRPAYAHKSAILETMRQRGFGKKEILLKEAPKRIIPAYGIVTGAIGLLRRDPKAMDRWRAAWRGFTAEERVTANEMFEKVGVRGVPGLGFLGEVAMDPLTAIAGTGVAKGLISKPLGAVARQAGRIPVVQKGIAAAGRVTAPIREAIRQKFITKSAMPALDDLIGKHLGERAYMSRQAIDFAVDLRGRIQNVASVTKSSIDDIVDDIVKGVELPKAAPGIEGTAPIVKDVKKFFERTLRREKRFGIAISKWENVERGIEYFPRITTQEARRYLQEASKQSVKEGGRRFWTKNLANAIRRKTGDFTLQEFNELVAKEGLESMGGKKVVEFFMKNPAYVAATRGIRSAKAISASRFLDEAGRLFGGKVGVALPDDIVRQAPKLAGLKFSQEVAEEISRIIPAYFNPEAAGPIKQAFDVVQNTWKRWTLAPFPKYHLRNMVGNLWNNYLAGVTDPRVYSRAQALQMYRKYGKVGGKRQAVALQNLKAHGLSPSRARQIIRDAEKTGVLGQGWFAADIEKGLEAEFEAAEGFVSGLVRRMKSAEGVKGKAIAGVKEAYNLPRRLVVGKGLALGTTVENNARLAHFIDKLGKGDDALTASQSVKKFLFDYGDLTQFERNSMKRIFPFYTWTRKNVPLQMEMLWKHPEKYLPLVHPLRTREPKDLMRLKYARPDLYDRLPVELRRDANTVTYVPLEGLIPAGDLVKLGEVPRDLANFEIPDFLVELLTPYLRAPIELKQNRSFYFESDIKKYSRETQPLLRMDIPVRMKYLLTTVIPQARLLNELNKLVKKQIRKEELTAGEQAFSQALSSIYKINTRDLRDRAVKEVDSKLRELERGRFWARRFERTEEGERIRGTYRALRQLRSELGRD